VRIWRFARWAAKSKGGSATGAPNSLHGAVALLVLARPKKTEPVRISSADATLAEKRAIQDLVEGTKTARLNSDKHPLAKPSTSCAAVLASPTAAT
jgi:hypothetical protein